MKKIMKKALSLMLALVMVFSLAPMTAMAEDPEQGTIVDWPLDILSNDEQTVTIPANSSLYFAANYMNGGSKTLNILTKPGVKVVTGYDWTGAGGKETDLITGEDWQTGEPIAFYYGLYIKQSGMQRAISFALKNTTDSDISATISFEDPIGSEKNPDYLVQGENIATVEGGGNYVYSWTPAKSGEMTITMSDDNEYGWFYDIYEDGTSIADNGQYSNYEGLSTYTVDVTADVEYRVAVNTVDTDPLTYMPLAGDVTFTMTYEATDKDPYIYKYNSIGLDDNEILVDGSAVVTICELNTWGQTGKYLITAPEGCKVSEWTTEDWGSTFTKKSSNETNTYEVVYDGSASVYIGFEGVTEATVNVTKTGDVSTGGGNTGNEYTNYFNEVTPEAYKFTGNADNLFYVWLEDGAKPTAVLGNDGYYHLGSATGPVLYVDLDMGMHPYYTVAGLQAVAAEGRLYHYNNKIDYSSALLEYAACKDSKTGLYPVTKDIKEILVEYGDGQGWYNPEGPAYLFGDAEVAEESAWLFMCCYEGVVDKTATDTKWVTDSKDGFVFKVNAEISDFLELKINDKVVDEKYYTLTEGSTIITVNADYMKTLATGDYTVAAVFTNAEGEEVSFTTALTVAAPAPVKNPDTGDHSNIALWIAVLGLGVVAIAGSVVMRKREF